MAPVEGSSSVPVLGNTTSKSNVGTVGGYVVDFLPLQSEVIFGEAVSLFNEKPSKGIDFLIENHAIERTPSDVAYFLLTHTKLSKRIIGEYLGDPSNFCQEVAELLFNYFPFANVTIDEGVRILARRIRLPGEAQKIDRIMEKFSMSYFTQNPACGIEQDTIYLLSFSIIMLNTDLHNPSIPKNRKMTLPQYIQNHRGIDNGRDVPPKLLSEIFNNIKKTPLTMNEEDMFESAEKSFIGPTKAGWLDKHVKGIMGRSLKRWFVLKDSCLYYFLTPNDKNPRCIIPLDGVLVSKIGNFEILLSSRNMDQRIKSGKFHQNTLFLSDGISVNQGTRENMILKAATEADCLDWYIHLRGETEPINAIVKQNESPRDSNVRDTMSKSIPQTVQKLNGKNILLSTSMFSRRASVSGAEDINKLVMSLGPSTNFKETSRATFSHPMATPKDHMDEEQYDSMSPTESRKAEAARLGALYIRSEESSKSRSVSRDSSIRSLFGTPRRERSAKDLDGGHNDEATGLTVTTAVVTGGNAGSGGSPSSDLKDPSLLTLDNLEDDNVVPSPLSIHYKKTTDTISLYLEGRAKLLQKTFSRASNATNNTLNDVTATDPLFIQIANPVREGWMLVRDCSSKYKYRNVDVWIPKYCIITESFDKSGATFFYFPTHEKALMMQTEGVQTQQRYIRLRTADYVCVNGIGPIDSSPDAVNAATTSTNTVAENGVPVESVAEYAIATTTNLATMPSVVPVEEQLWKKIETNPKKATFSRFSWKQIESRNSIDRRTFPVQSEESIAVASSSGTTSPTVTPASSSSSTTAGATTTATATAPSIASGVNNYYYNAPRISRGSYQCRIRCKDLSHPFDIFLTHENERELSEWIKALKDVVIDSD